MAGLFDRATGTGSTHITGDLSKDIQLLNPPEDSISGLAWSPVANYLAVSSWDSKVRIYDVIQNKEGTGVAVIDFQGPVLSCDWSKDGNKVVGASTDKTAKILDLGANGAPAQQVATHDAPIRNVKFCEATGSRVPVIVTGSWDKTIKYWDMRQQKPLATLQCHDKVYAMDVKDNLLVVGTAANQIYEIDLDQPDKFRSKVNSPLKHQLRALSIFKEANGYTVGGIEGRCAFQYSAVRDEAKNMAFKCHRDSRINGEVKVWTINAIATHPTQGIIVTGGSDGMYNFWDKVSRTRLKAYSHVGGSISALAFNRTGDVLAYSISYDWHKGYTANTPDYPNQVMLHPILPDETKPRSTVLKR